MASVEIKAARPPQVVQLSQGDSGSPLFLFHAADGSASVYEPMKAAFRGQHTVFALEDALLDEASPTQQMGLEDLAITYLAKIKAIQPAGPYFLGGYSFGGLVAFEVSQRLQEAGEKVAYLFLMETPNPRQSLTRRALKERVTAFLESRRQLNESTVRASLALALRTLNGAATRVIHESVTFTANTFPTRPRSYLRRIWVRERNDAAFEAYRPLKPYKQPCDLWVCENQGDKFVPVKHLGWSGLLPGLCQCHEVSGNHLAFMRPNCLEDVAQSICNTMDMSQAVKPT